MQSTVCRTHKQIHTHAGTHTPPTQTQCLITPVPPLFFLILHNKLQNNRSMYSCRSPWKQLPNDSFGIIKINKLKNHAHKHLQGCLESIYQPPHGRNADSFFSFLKPHIFFILDAGWNPRLTPHGALSIHGRPTTETDCEYQSERQRQENQQCVGGGRICLLWP